MEDELSYQSSFFDDRNRLEKLKKLNDPLVFLKKHVDFEIFRVKLEGVLAKEAKSPAGRPPYDVILMFKILILQRFYNISDDQIEFQITDRASFCRFLGIYGEKKVPDSTTIWLFKKRLAETKIVEELFEQFLQIMDENDLVGKEGIIIDASFVEVPRQRNSRKENEEIKKGNVPEGWKEEPEKEAQKDVDARWAKKNEATYYGYKNHIKVDAKNGFIMNYCVSDAAKHDSQAIFNLINEEDRGKILWADSAYKSEEIDKKIKEHGIYNMINKKGNRRKPLSKFDQMINRVKSSIRARVEHVFGFMRNTMKVRIFHSIGIKRISATIGLTNLVYNILRYVQICKVHQPEYV